jgi:hypothetical protein
VLEPMLFGFSRNTSSPGSLFSLEGLPMKIFFAVACLILVARAIRDAIRSADRPLLGERRGGDVVVMPRLRRPQGTPPALRRTDVDAPLPCFISPEITIARAPQ